MSEPLPNAFRTREEWLCAFVSAATPIFAAKGYSVPSSIRVSVGYPSTGRSNKRIGECHSSAASADGTNEIFIHPSMSDASRIADILTHEVVHVVVGLEAGHKAPFKRCAEAMGLGGKMTATIATAAWHEWADPILASLGPLPHAALRCDGKKQGTRMVKCTCGQCGFVFRTTQKWLNMVNDAPQCPDPECEGYVMDCEG